VFITINYHKILLKWTLTNNNSGTDWIQLVTPLDIIQLNPVTNTNSGALLAFMLVCDAWLRILPITFALVQHSDIYSSYQAALCMCTQALLRSRTLKENTNASYISAFVF
jgi:hypothetical protein